MNKLGKLFQINRFNILVKSTHGDCIMHLGGRGNWELHHGHNHLMQCSTLPTLKGSRLIYKNAWRLIQDSER